jgi:hypothetical protein
MITSKLRGGLGNQLFQYAIGLQLSTELNTMLKLDLSDYEKQDNIRSYKLDVFNIEVPIATPEEIRGYEKKQKQITSIKGYRFFKKLIPLKWFSIIQEPYYHYTPSINKIGKNHLLIGNWQTEKYFDKVIPQLRRNLTLKNKLSNDAQYYAEKISNVNAISVHIRRGDYVSVPKFAERFGTCSTEYYQTATEYLLSQIPDAHFFVFTDDLKWVKAHPELFSGCEKVTYIENTTADYEDLILMSKCKHHILANSSFSWWGAWLNASTQKIITAPKIWFAGLPHDTSDLIPKSWIRL